MAQLQKPYVVEKTDKGSHAVLQKDPLKLLGLFPTQEMAEIFAEALDQICTGKCGCNALPPPQPASEAA